MARSFSGRQLRSHTRLRLAPPLDGPVRMGLMLYGGLREQLLLRIFPERDRMRLVRRTNAGNLWLFGIRLRLEP